MRSESFDRPTTGTSFQQPTRNLESSSSTRSVPSSFTMHDFALDRHNLGVHRPRKLTPLERLPKTSQVRIDDSNNERLLHLSVHYNPGTVGGWKQTLDPIGNGGQMSGNERIRKETYSISKLPKFQ